MNKLVVCYKGINDYLMIVCFLFLKKKFIILISVYVIIMINFDEKKERFYEDLRDFIVVVFWIDKFIIFGDFNIWVGRDYMLWEGVLGKYGIGKCNCSGFFLLEICVVYDFFIINIVFCLFMCNKILWMYLCCKYWYFFDYVIIR